MNAPLSYRPPVAAAHYRPRRCEPLHVLWSFALAAALAVAGGAIYSVLLVKLESVYYRAGAVAVAALATGLLGMIPVRIGKVQSTLLACMIGATLGLIALYAMWIAWLLHVLSSLGYPVSWFALVTRPVALVELIRLVNSGGVWAYNGRLVHGVALSAFWIGEAALILGSATLLPTTQSAGQTPVCPTCRTRCKALPRLRRLSADEQDTVLAEVDARNFAALADVPPPENDDAPELDLSILTCPRCGQLNLLSVTRIWWGVEATGIAKVRTQRLAEHLMISADEAIALQAALDATNGDDDVPEGRADDPTS